ncbi:MAG: hemolysin D [Acidobacteriota bacterium]
MRNRWAIPAVAILLATSPFVVPSRILAYTQSGVGVSIFNTIPMGHEWVTRMAGIELLGYTPASAPDVVDPKDPRSGWTLGKAKNLNLSSPGAQAEVQRIKGVACPQSDDACARYAARYKPVYDAIVGERWVDIAGYNVIAGKVPAIASDCWDAVAQEPVEVQYDHFMRRYDDSNGEGGSGAAYRSQVRFIKYFVAAAMAPSSVISVYDGGAAGSTAVQVDRNYFLFGRTVHLFEDSFSSEHTVRVDVDNFTKVRQVKSYLCAKGSEQHTHSNLETLSYASGDVVWNKGTGLNPFWGGYKASNMKTPALVAVEATKDLWAAFIRTMGIPPAQREAVAVAEATALVNNWLSFDSQEVTGWYANPANRLEKYVLADGDSGPGDTVQQCMDRLSKGTTQQAYVAKLQALQNVCLYNAVPWPGYEDLFDTSMHTYFSWQWRSPLTYQQPPAGWTIPDLPADSGTRVRIKSVVNGQYLTAPSGLASGSYVYAKGGSAPLEFTLVGARDALGVRDNATLRMTDAPLLFLSYTAVTGAGQLFAPGWVLSPTNYTITRIGQTQNSAIKSIYWNEYLYLNAATQSPYIDNSGNPGNANAQWYLEPKQNVTSGNQCCWDRLVQGCSKDSQCDPGGEGCVYSGTKTAQYGAFQCNVTKCCWDRLLQSCSQSSECDPGGEGCIASGTPTLTYGTFQCNTCEMQGQVYDRATSSCKPK